MFKVGRAKPRERRFDDTTGVGLNRMTVSEIHSSDGEAGLAGSTGWWCPRELGAGLDQRASVGDRSCVGSAGGTWWCEVSRLTRINTSRACRMTWMWTWARGQGGVELRSQRGEQFG